MSLIELVAVVTLMGIFASVAIARLGPTVFGEIGAGADARKVALALLQAKRRAIVNGQTHAVIFQGSGASTSFTVAAVDGSGTATTVDGPFVLTRNVSSSVSAATMLFNFEGQALGPYTITLNGSHRSWQISVIPINGSVSTVETTH